MKFSELREADLSKAQIKKVHDKADDLSKSDFIKRYGKEGDAVRFATATNIVKKQLGIDEGVIGNKWRKSARSARPNLKIGNIELVRADNPKTDVHTIKVNGKKIGSFSLDSDHWVVNIDGKKGQGTYNEIDDIIKDIRKGKMYFEALDESIIGVNKKSVEYKNGRAAAEKGTSYDKNPHTPGTKRLNWSMGHNDFRADKLRKSGKPNYGARGQFEELDKEDEKSIGDVIKGLKKAVKSHQGQVKSLTKDIQDEVEVTEARIPSDNDIKKKHGNATPMKSYKQGFDAANKGKKITTNPHKSMFGFDRGAWNKGFTDADQGFNIKTFSQNDYDDKGVMKKEEVVTEAVSAALVNQISRMTDRNNHFGVRIELARIAGDKELMRYYDSLEKMHNKLGGVIGNSAIEVRQKLESVLKNRLQRKFNDSDADRLMGAL